MNLFNKYKEDHETMRTTIVNYLTFRPTIVIDEEFDDSYCEDEF